MKIRHSHKVAIIAAITTFVLTGCISLGPPKPAEQYPTHFETAPAPKALPVSKIDTGDLFDDKNLDDTLGETSRVVVSGFNVTFVLKNKVSASVSGGRTLGGGTSSGAKASMDVSLAGVSGEDMQAIVDAMYADFIAQLSSSGREIIPVDKMRSSVGYRAFKFHDPISNTPFFKEAELSDPRTTLTMSPTGLPLWFNQAEGSMGITDNANTFAQAYLAFEHDAVAIRVSMVIDFADLSSSGNSSGFFGGGTAEVGAAANLAIKLARIDTTMGDKNSLISAWGTFYEDGKRSLSKGNGYGVFKELDSNRDSGVILPLGSFNFTSAATNRSSHAIVTDPKTYRSQVLDMAQALNATFIKAANENRP